MRGRADGCNTLVERVESRRTTGRQSAVQRLNEPRPLPLAPRRIHLTSASYEASSQPKRMELLLFGRRFELCNPLTLICTNLLGMIL